MLHSLAQANTFREKEPDVSFNFLFLFFFSQGGLCSNKIVHKSPVSKTSLKRVQLFWWKPVPSCPSLSSHPHCTQPLSSTGDQYQNCCLVCSVHVLCEKTDIRQSQLPNFGELMTGKVGDPAQYLISCISFHPQSRRDQLHLNVCGNCQRGSLSL